jgi:hypothetical protein
MVSPELDLVPGPGASRRVFTILTDSAHNCTAAAPPS